MKGFGNRAGQTVKFIGDSCMLLGRKLRSAAAFAFEKGEGGGIVEMGMGGLEIIGTSCVSANPGDASYSAVLRLK